MRSQHLFVFAKSDEYAGRGNYHKSEQGQIILKTPKLHAHTVHQKRHANQ